MIKFTEKVTIITGASSGIGQATAVLFASLGSNLVLIGRNEERLKKTVELCCKHPICEDQILLLVGDLTEVDFCRKIAEETIKRFNKINVLVNNAGIVKFGNLASIHMSDYDEIMDVNVRTAMNLSKLCMPHLISAKGSIVNVSSVAGSSSNPDMMSYCMSKAALDMFTKCAALELASKQVRVNSVNPGLVDTNIQRAAGLSDEDFQKTLDRAKKNYPMGRYGKPEEIANCIAFLASDQASFITGTLVSIAGGRNIFR